tara:strand:- start:1384 stop:2118 length:735 start_codon:yes stop_codon:yes gene_type:complete
MSQFTITTESFSGPIDILLRLIEKRKLPINDVSLAAIADDYLHFLEHDGFEQNLSSRTHFVFVASTLVLIKSKSLLPSLELTDEEEEDIATLKKRLALFSLFQKRADGLKNVIGAQPKMFTAKAKKRTVVFSPTENISKKNLLNALRDVLQEVPELPSKKKESGVEIVIHIQKLMNSLVERIQSSGKVIFNDFIQKFTQTSQTKKETKVYTIVGFLGMLEMSKNKQISVHQNENFESITMENYE